MRLASEMNLSDHLEELRRRLIVVLITVGLFSVVCFFLSDQILELVVLPIMRTVDSLYFLSPYEAFMTKVKLSLVAGIVLSLPIIFYQLWKFVSPGLYSNEREKVLPLVFISTGLFLMGVLFAYYGIIPFALNFFLNFQSRSLVPLISIGSYISFFLSFVLIFGIVFELPVILLGLIALGVMKTDLLIAQRKVAIVLIFIAAAVLTPTVDIISQFLLAIPLWVLFELSIFVGKKIERKMDLNRNNNI